MSASRNLRRLSTLTVLALVGLGAACSSDDNGTEPIDDDLVVGGLIIQNSGVNLASVLGNTVGGSLNVPEGQSGPTLDVFFVDSEGLQFEVFENESMQAEIADESTATFQQEGLFSFSITGVTAGETEIVFQFVQAGEVTYTSPGVPVNVIGPSQ